MARVNGSAGRRTPIGDDLRSRRGPRRYPPRRHGRAPQDAGAQLLLALQLARRTTEPDPDLGQRAPGEVLEAVGPLVACRDDGRLEPLDVAVLVAADGTRVVGGDDAAADVPVRPALGTDDEDQPEIRQLVVGQPDRRGAERFVNVLEPVGMDRRPDPVADRRGSRPASGGPAPGVEREVAGQLRGDEYADAGVTGRPRARRGRGPASRARPPRAPAELLLGARDVDPPHGRRDEVESASRSVVLPAPWASPATITGNRASIRTHASAASSASSVPAPMSSTIERTRRRGGRPQPGKAIVHRADDDRRLASERSTIPGMTVAALIEIVPLTPDRWDDVATLFGEGGDPRQCWCMYWRVRSNGWRVGDAAESRDRMHALVDEGATRAGPPRLSRRPRRRLGQRRTARGLRPAVHSRVRPELDDVPVWCVVCFVISKTARGEGLTSRSARGRSGLRPGTRGARPRGLSG